MSNLQELQRRNAEREKEIKSRSKGGRFFKLANDRDMVVVKLVAPFEGFDVYKKSQFTGKYQWKIHYRLHVLGDWNENDEESISNPPLELTIDDVRALKDDDAKIWSTPEAAYTHFKDQTNKGHSILVIKRFGQPKDQKTTYTVNYAVSADDDELTTILPKLSKSDLAKLQSEEKFQMMTKEEIEELRESVTKKPEE